MYRNVVYAVPVAQVCADTGESLEFPGNISRQRVRRKCPLNDFKAFCCLSKQRTPSGTGRADKLAYRRVKTKQRQKQNTNKRSEIEEILDVNQSFYSSVTYLLNR